MSNTTKAMSQPLRVGAVNYLNAKPLIYGLKQNRRIELTLDLPSCLADALAAGRLDVALIPSVELFSNEGYAIVSDACIACRGPVLSVRLYFRVSPSKVSTLALDEGSRTSSILARLLLREQFGLAPRTEVLPIGEGLSSTAADAVLLIGDRAMREPKESFFEVWDLGKRWWQWTDLPFIFAVWAARPGVDLSLLKTDLAQARDQGVANVEAIAAAEAESIGITQQQCVQYLNENLHFTFGERERRGFLHFYDQAARLGLVQTGWEPFFHDCTMC